MHLCQQSGCTKPAGIYTRGYCKRHYRKRLLYGEYGYRDAESARAHVRQLRALGWTYEQIAEAAGISAWVAHHLDTRPKRHVKAETERALLAVPLVPRASHRPVSHIGTQRRVRALMRMGWTTEEVARRAGIKVRTLRTVISRGGMSYNIHLRVARVYDELSHTPGPSGGAAGKARHLGYAPPLAWDDDTIDDPNATPQGVERDSGRTPSAELYEEVKHLAGYGLSSHEIAKRLGWTVVHVNRIKATYATPTDWGARSA
ncbi:hypothetical protein GCM10012275_28560 [Longimycelium tulufanense]|uniref:Uncharacterized protein n=2 Tax=Longimycelium tulufanense TaxID=907463 RepID=A0A8J3CEJ4_9PSEU|nr:hypothetical protein GCM10012275_28560 [Longimycelium tulufanense]